MRKFRSEWGGIVTIDELKNEHWLIAREIEGLTEEEYPFEDYLHDCLSKNGGALTEIKDHKVLVAVSIFLLACVIVLITGIVGANAETAHRAFVVLENRDGVLNVRTAPVDGDIVGFLSDGRDIAVLDSLNNWALICNPGNYTNPLGWVCMDYIHVYGGEIVYTADQK